MVGGFLKNNL